MIRGTFSGNGTSGLLRLARGRALRLTLTVVSAQTFLGTLTLQQSANHQGGWSTARDVNGAAVVVTGPLTSPAFDPTAATVLLASVPATTFFRVVVTGYAGNPVGWRLQEVLDPYAILPVSTRAFDATYYRPGGSTDPAYGSWVLTMVFGFAESFAIDAQRRLHFSLDAFGTATNIGTGLGVELPGGLTATETTRQACAIRRNNVDEIGFVDVVEGDRLAIVYGVDGGGFPNGADATFASFQLAVAVAPLERAY